MTADTAEITQLLVAYSDGDRDALDLLMPRVYQRLRQIAHLHLRNERDDHTLRTTDLVHEAYLALIDQDQVTWQSRIHFFALASRMMRNILVDHARARVASKRGAGVRRTVLDGKEIALPQSSEEIVALDEALGLLAEQDERLAQVVELRFFGGLTIEETAQVLDVSHMTVSRDWNKAKAWLFRILTDRVEQDAGP